MLRNGGIKLANEESAVKTYGKKVVLTTWTILIWIMRSPTMLMLVVGFGTGYYFGFQSGKASVLPRTVKAEKDLMELQAGMTKALERSAVAQIAIRDSIRRQHDDQQIKLDALNLHLADVRRDVRLCEQQSVMPVPPATPGANPEENTGQPRAADVVLQELAAQIARQCDGTAIQLNALIDWIERTRGN